MDTDREENKKQLEEFFSTTYTTQEKKFLILVDHFRELTGKHFLTNIELFRLAKKFLERT
jgi:hypothetical protein